MWPDPALIAKDLSIETGLEFSAREGRNSDGQRWIELQPTEYPPSQTFSLRTIVGWRQLEAHFRPGSFSSDLIRAMGVADMAGRRTFDAVLNACRNAGADVAFEVNGSTRELDDSTVWEIEWRSVALVLRKGMLAINDGDSREDAHQIKLWTSRLAAAVLSLMPFEAERDPAPAAGTSEGYPEGACIQVEINRYERDQRNRTAAIAIHGYRCQACNLDMGERYGAVATGLIEVHHVMPVSQLGKDYVVNPQTDLTPLCPNCHAVAHRRAPPFSVAEIRQMLSLEQDDLRI